MMSLYVVVVAEGNIVLYERFFVNNEVLSIFNFASKQIWNRSFVRAVVKIIKTAKLETFLLNIE